MQLVLSGSDQHPDLRLLDNPHGRPPLSFEDPDHHVHVPQMGTKALIELAAVSAQSGYRIARFEIADDRFELLSDEELEEELSSALLDALNRGGAHFAEGLLNAELEGYLVFGVAMFRMGEPTVTVRRNGVVLTQQQREPLQGFLRRAWQKLSEH